MKRATAAETVEKPKKFFTRLFSVLGPGLITGAADDDPSGIATYSIAGAQLGTSLLWTALITWPLMGCVQFMCARIGMVTGKGLAAALAQRIPRWLLVVMSIALFVANSINVGSDLSGMADAGAMLTGWRSHYFVVVFGVGIGYWTVRCSYEQIAMILKWLALCLFAYVITAFVARPHWSAVIHDTFIPTWPKGREGWQNLVALLGTTISPYLFFWQTSQETEHEKAIGRRSLAQRRGATHREIVDRKLDVGAGTFFSNVVMYFIILTAASTLHVHGVTKIESTKQAAEALRPLAGSFAYFLFTAGLIGVGLLAIPTLTGASAYAFAETFKWREGLDKSFRGAQPFYTVLIFSIAVGVAMDFVGINPVKALFWTAVINGVLAPFLLLGVLYAACDKKLMLNQPSSWLARGVVGLATVLMFAAAIGMFVFS